MSKERGEPPETIYLQWHGPGDPKIDDGPVDPADVSWCEDKIFDHDVEYRQVKRRRRTKK